MNAVIAITILSAVFLLKDGASRYQPFSVIDTEYVKASGQETNPEILQNGIRYTEAARAIAYSSMIKQSHGVSIIGIVVCLAFVANSVFIFRMANQQKQTVAE